MSTPARLRALEVGLCHEADDPLRDLDERLPGAVGSRRLGQRGSVLLAVPTFLAKALGIGAIFAVVDNSFSKLRLFKITEFMAAAFLLAVLAVLVLYLSGR